MTEGLNGTYDGNANGLDRGHNYDAESVRAGLFASSTKRRLFELQALHEQLVKQELTDEDCAATLHFLLETYSFYIDRASRQAVQQCLSAITATVHADDYLSTLADFLHVEASKLSVAPSALFVLVEWCSVLLQQLAVIPQLWETWGLKIVLPQSQILGRLINAESKEGRRHSAFVVTRRGLRAIFRNPKIGGRGANEIITTLTMKAASSTAANSILLGVVAGVCHRLPSLRHIIQERASDYYDFYSREIIGSRTVVAVQVANGLQDFFKSFATQDAFVREVVPALEKALLRAPEVVLNDLVNPLVRSIPSNIDLSETLSQHLLKPLLSNVKSSNASVRDGALSGFCGVLSRCTQSQILSEIVEEVLKALKDAKSADHRTLYAAMLAAIPPSASSFHTVLPGVCPLASKETNEAALRAEVRAIGRQVAHSLSHGSGLDSSTTKAFVTGLGDKKSSVRRIWALQFGDITWTLTQADADQPAASQFLETMLDKIISIWDEAIASPVAATQTGLIVVAYIVIALSISKLANVQNAKLASTIKKCDVERHVLGSDGKPSMLFSHRVYAKLTAEDDLIWSVRALAAAPAVFSSRETVSTGYAGIGWAQAVIYMMTAVAVHPTLRRDASQALTRAYLDRPELIADLLTKGLWQWLRNVDMDDKDTPGFAAKSGKRQLSLAVRAICLSPKEASGFGKQIDVPVLHNQLIKLLVMCRSSMIPQVEWIELCLHTGVDPKDLVSRNPENCLDEIRRWTSHDIDTHSREVHRAACDAAAELAFIAPDVITSKLVELIVTDLNTEQLQNAGPTEAAIYRTPDGHTFVNVLSKTQENTIPDKNVKDYDTLKWEQELRAQLAEKQGQQKTLSVEDQAKVKAQLAKEATIRQGIAVVHVKLCRGIGIICSLARGPPTNTEAWISTAVNALFQVINAGAGLVVGDAAALAYLSCADLISQRLGTLRLFIGVATLRAQGTSQLPPELEGEPLGDLVTRVLYRLRFSAEQRPFDLVSLSYMLPLIEIILVKGGIARSTADEADEQITLALEFLSFHADQFSSPRLPRREISALLMQSMQRYNQHYKTIKDCLLEICHAIAPDVTDAEVAVFLHGCIVPEISVRISALQGIDMELELHPDRFVVEIWLACHDDIEENVELALTIWEENSLKTEMHSSFEIIPFLHSLDVQLRRSAARALAGCVERHADVSAEVVLRLQDLYIEKAKPKLPERDAYGMPRKVDLADPWEARHGVALAFKELVPLFAPDSLVQFIQFLVERGPLADRNMNVREQMVDAATTLITVRGATMVEELMKIFEDTLEAPDSGSKDYDKVKEAVIIMYGALARHLKAGDERISKVVNRLLLTLSTPSEVVQFAIASCLPPLIQNSPSHVSDYMREVMIELLESKHYASRRGAAYGLAGIVRGKGVSALREFRVMSSLRAASEEKKDQNRRQGAFLAFELLSLILGPIFEPYVIQIVPQLLAGFGDASTDVRDACLDAAKTSFASLSSFGVKQVLPTLLEGLDDQQWRSKKGACDSLGAMAYLDPQQLAISLPEIIPPLTNVLNDSHKEVRISANRSLQRFGEVISNPEIKGLVGILLKALSDPTKYTDEALDALLKVSFTHYLDAPSLALVVRILERGLGDRSATKRKGSQIIGSLAHLTDRKDLIVHLPILVSGLRVAAVDPVPTTRATASKALGSLVEKLGEDALPDLIPSLMSALKADTGAGDRLGSAQALSEVLAGLGIGRLEETLPSILQNVTSTKAAVREGFISLFIFLPACFGNSFANYLSKIIPPILSGLADDVESIRETSLRAGRLLVKNFATRSIDLLLPELQRGLADDNHRIRLSSVELVGDLLFNLTGISTKADDDEVEESATAAGQSLLEVLGEEKRNNILSAIYISRCDTSGLVRTAAINVWKALVATPRTLREITPTLTQVLIRRLASSNPEQKLIAGHALGELIRKAGDGVLASLLPTLEDGLQTSVDADEKQGICIALRELMTSAMPDSLDTYEPKLVSVVRTGLVDSDEDVREAAAEAFDAMQRLFGKRVIDEILPNLLVLLRDEDEAENALAALLTLLTEGGRSNIILPNLLPTLLASPISAFNARALASLASVAGQAMTRRLSNILNSLLDNIISCKESERLDALDAAFDAVLLSIDEFDGLNTAMSVMLGLVKHDDHRKRTSADLHLANFFTKTDLDYSRYYTDLIRALLISFNDGDEEVVKAAWTALSTLTSRLRKEDMESLVVSTRQVLGQVGVPGHNLPGFSLPKGISAILPIFLQGLINGTAEQRTQSAFAISEIIDKTSGDSLKPFVTQITGPLIRVVSERSVEVKAAILLTLNNLLEKIPTFLKPFLPQLQRTFTKALADTSSEILRTRAAKALGTLITMTPRIDPLIGELVTGSKTSDPVVKNAMQNALYEVVSKAGASMNEVSRCSIIGLIDDETGDSDSAMVITSARLFGALIKNLSPEVSAGLIKSRVLSMHQTKLSILALNATLLESPIKLTQTFARDTVSTICKGIASSEVSIVENSVLAAGKYLLIESSNKSFDTSKVILEALVPLLQPGSALDARRLALVVIRTISRENNDLVRPHLSLLAPPVFTCVRDLVIPIKLSAEAAFLAMFCVVEDENTVFDKYMAGPGASLPTVTKRSMQDYFKRVALRLGVQARERREAEGGQGGLELSSDEKDDEREIWSVGKVDLGESSFDD